MFADCYPIIVDGSIVFDMLCLDLQAVEQKGISCCTARHEVFTFLTHLTSFYLDNIFHVLIKYEIFKRF